jgi:ElaB/YqjD/DUF883 family membrane-anchored ribosome-binding protein
MITLKLDQNELQALAALMDAGLKSLGLSAAKTAASLLEKLEQAVAEANAKPEQETE